MTGGREYRRLLIERIVWATVYSVVGLIFTFGVLYEIYKMFKEIV